MEAVSERALGAAVNEEGDGVFFFGVEVGGFYDVAVDSFVVPAFEGELFVVAHFYGGDFFGVDTGELAEVGTIGIQGVDFGG